MESQFGHLRFPFAQAKRRVEAKLLSAGQGVADDGKLSVITRAWRPSRTIESSFAPERKEKGSKLIMDHVSILHGLPFIPVELARFGPSFCFHVNFCDFLSSPSSEVNLADEDAWITAAKQPL